MRSVGCVVVGGGPAGLRAGRTAARHGVRVLLVDENAELGGQYYRQMPDSFHAPGDAKPGEESAEGRRLIDEVRALGVELRLGAVVWGIFDQRIVALATRDETERIGAETLILAPGGYDRPVPFPGCTPGHVRRRGVGSTAVTGAVVARCDDRWGPVGATETHFDADTVVVGYGFVSSLELSRLAGCDHRYDAELGGYVPVRNREMES